MRQTGILYTCGRHVYVPAWARWSETHMSYSPAGISIGMALVGLIAYFTWSVKSDIALSVPVSLSGVHATHVGSSKRMERMLKPFHPSFSVMSLRMVIASRPSVCVIV